MPEAGKPRTRRNKGAKRDTSKKATRSAASDVLPGRRHTRPIPINVTESLNRSFKFHLRTRRKT